MATWTHTKTKKGLSYIIKKNIVKRWNKHKNIINLNLSIYIKNKD